MQKHLTNPHKRIVFCLRATFHVDGLRLTCIGDGSWGDGRKSNMHLIPEAETSPHSQLTGKGKDVVCRILSSSAGFLRVTMGQVIRLHSRIKCENNGGFLQAIKYLLPHDLQSITLNLSTWKGSLSPVLLELFYNVILARDRNQNSQYLMY